MIKLFATHAQDYLIKNGIESVQHGGPAFFIESVLNEKKIKYINYQKQIGIVKILIENNEEFGMIEKVGEIDNYPEIFADDNILISTLLKEVDLDKFIACENVYIDFQGYTRKVGGNFGEKEIFFPPNNFKPLVVKVTKGELEFLDNNFIEDQKTRILIVTNGAQNISVWRNNILKTFPINSILHPKDSIGAGDTFFTNFCVSYIEGKNLDQSILLAKGEVEKFLLLK